MKKLMLLLALISLTLASAANAAVVLISSNIDASTTWTADNVYRLQQQIYVLPGATLTIQPGTLVQSTTGLGGSLAVCRGARIYADGTKSNPIIMTSTSDDLRNWHVGANEWGNLTVLGNGLISASHFGGAAVTYQDGYTAPVVTNTKTPTGLNKKQMEGLVADGAGDPKVIYGGGDDNDNSGSISYCSFRYGGKVFGLGNELNGLSLGAIGRETDVHHIDILNNVDDGIEVWGGTVNLSFLNIWNIGDDNLDIDEGYRGKVQFGLIVQGYSAGAAQGSGVGDNCFEIDGAEDSDAQPVTTTSIYNFTVVGQPIAGDHGTAWRDGARIQYRNCIFMELGEQLIKNDNSDGDGANGYGYNGSLTWNQIWTTPYTYSASGVAPNVGTWTTGDFNDPAVLYQAQTSGNLAEMSDCVFYNNLHASAYTMYNTVSALPGSNNINNVIATVSPIQRLVRGAAVTPYTGLTIVPVTYINPCPANDALTSVNTAPNDGFLKPAQYRGGFSANHNWLEGWTAQDAYGMTDTSMNTTNGDVNDDGMVDLGDFMILGLDWLKVI
jgi:hypothetical protein